MPHQHPQAPTYTARMLKQDFAAFFGISATLTLIALFTNADALLAKALYHPLHPYELFIKHYGQIPALIIGVTGLIALSFAHLRKHLPTEIRHTLLVWIFTLLLGSGAFIHLFAKEAFIRPRPRETVLLGGTQPAAAPFGLNLGNLLNTTTTPPAQPTEGKSFPSGHVSMGAVFIVPFFTLRKKRPKLARLFFICSITLTLLIGLGRMMAGAHYATDVLWSLTFITLIAATLTHTIPETARLNKKHLASILLTAAVLFIGGLLLKR